MGGNSLQRRADIAVLVATQAVAIVAWAVTLNVWAAGRDLDERNAAGWSHLERLSRSLDPPSAYLERSSRLERWGEVDCWGLMMTCDPGSAMVARSFTLPAGREHLGCDALANHAVRSWGADVVRVYDRPPSNCSVRLSVDGDFVRIYSHEDELVIQVSRRERG